MTYNATRTFDHLNRRLAASSTSAIELTLKNGACVSIGRGSDGYSLYLGCELVTGDASLYTVSKLVCQIAASSKEHLRAEFGDFAV